MFEVISRVKICVMMAYLFFSFTGLDLFETKDVELDTKKN